LVIGIVIFFALSFAIESKRNFGSAIFKIKSGRANAGAFLRGFFSLKLMLNRGFVIGWLIGLGALGGVYASLLSTISDMIQKNNMINKMLEQMPLANTVSSNDLISAIILVFIPMIFTIWFLVIAGASIALISRNFSADEKEHRTELYYSYPISRRKVLLSGFFVACIYSVVISMSFTLCFGLLAHFTYKDAAFSFIEIVNLGLVKSLVPLLFVALTLFFASINANYNVFSWGYLIFCFISLMFADLLHLPNWVKKISVLDYNTKFPVEVNDLKFCGIVILIIIILVVVSNIIYKKRDIK
jgi:ABC-2 type transport system permease protein